MLFNSALNSCLLMQFWQIAIVGPSSFKLLIVAQVRQQCVSMMAYLAPVTSTYTARNTERYPFSILPFGVLTATRAAVGRLHSGAVGHFLRLLALTY